MLFINTNTNTNKNKWLNITELINKTAIDKLL